FAGRLNDLAALPDVMGDGLLDIDVFACLNGPDGRQRMPVVGRGDGDHVDGFILQQLSDVGETVHAGGLGGEAFDAAIENVTVHIAQGGHPNVLEGGESADVVGAAAMKADDGHADLFVGAALGPGAGG